MDINKIRLTNAATRFNGIKRRRWINKRFKQSISKLICNFKSKFCNKKVNN